MRTSGVVCDHVTCRRRLTAPADGAAYEALNNADDAEGALAQLLVCCLDVPPLTDSDRVLPDALNKSCFERAWRQARFDVDTYPTAFTLTKRAAERAVGLHLERRANRGPAC